jgi:curved DNA-binding protein CbpA
VSTSNHYDTLGVAPDATPDEIKQAARKAASSAHPDRAGGSTERMASVNMAREVLSDPERRAHYDRTGADNLGPTIETEAGDILLQLFGQAIESSDGNWLQEVSQMIQQHRSGLLQVQQQAQAKRARIVRRAGKIKVRDGAQNLVQMLLDSRLRELDAQLAKVERGLQIAKAAADMLAQYEGGEVEQAPTIIYRNDPYGQQASGGQFWTSMFGART